MNAASIHSTKLERLITALERNLHAVEYVSLFGYPSGKQTQLERVELGSDDARWALLDDAPAHDEDAPPVREIVDAVVQRVVDLGTQRLATAPEVARGDGVQRVRIRVIAYGPKGLQKLWSRTVAFERAELAPTPQEKLASWASTCPPASPTSRPCRRSSPSRRCTSSSARSPSSTSGSSWSLTAR